MALVDHLRAVSTGEKETFAFLPKDWRPGAIPLLMWHAASEINRLQGLLADKDYIKTKAAYNSGHLSHAGWLESRERSLEAEMYRRAP